MWLYVCVLLPQGRMAIPIVGRLKYQSINQSVIHKRQLASQKISSSLISTIMNHDSGFIIRIAHSPYCSPFVV